MVIDQDNMLLTQSSIEGKPNTEDNGSKEYGWSHKKREDTHLNDMTIFEKAFYYLSIHVILFP